MEIVTIIGVDLAKNVFQLHGAAADGSVVFRRKLSRLQLCKFMASHPPCVCGDGSVRQLPLLARQMARLGHEPGLIAPSYVKPFIKRQKNDAADAEAIVEATQPPTMRFVEPKTEGQQSRAIVFRTREQFVNQRTELVNALRTHLYEFGYVAPQGIGHLRRLAEIVEDGSAKLPVLVREICSDILDQIDQLSSRLEALKKKIDALSKEASTSRRLQTMPGVGPITALAIETFARPMETFKCGRDFAAWLGLVPRQKSTGGKQRLGKVSKMGQRDIRRLLIIGAMAVVRWASRRGARRLLAGPLDGEEIAHAGGNRAGQQDGAWHLGHADETGELPGSGDGACVIPRGALETGTSGK